MTPLILPIFLRRFRNLIWKDSVIYIHGLAVYLNKRLPFARDLSLENSVDSYLSFWLALLLFPLLIVFFIFMHSFWSNTDKVLSINPSDNVFVFGVLKVHLKDWLTYSGWNDRTDDLTQIVNFPAWIPGCDSHSPAILDLLLLILAFILQWPSLHWEILFMLLSQFPLTFHQTQKGISHFIA